ncbi:hypothetical protein IQ241_22325 [Romeria aff. gracilis LEGE 07310]|uniref:Uncharacterized protein n=1 Tax=Vasconcelosia minhoensis LEGE 07310 TaxID=915328 RepID=A0A8J7B0J0_9CYAN|nr:hypothetical protein [Romeria gracilis]MBE9079992.1 hypothetical protein [Romeria aff. gracilis LEGE 07310]
MSDFPDNPFAKGDLLGQGGSDEAFAEPEREPLPPLASDDSKTSKSSKGRKSSKKSRSAADPGAVSNRADDEGAISPPPATGYKVQILAKIPVSKNTNVPGRDYLWFATYPIIPRTGDCLFHDGMYFRVERVFLYENTRLGWYADVEVTYYGQRR